MKREETTGRLDKVLESVYTEKEAGKYIDEHIDNDKPASLSEFLDAYVASKELDMTQVIKDSGISRNYVYNILNGQKRPGRDKVIALCVGARMSVAEAGRALKIAGYSPLYSKDERDVRIIICLNNGVHDVTKLNIYLETHGAKPLAV